MRSIVPRFALIGAVVVAMASALALAPTGTSASTAGQTCAPLHGKYTVAGTANTTSGPAESLTINLQGTINSGRLTCFATGKGSYSASGAEAANGRANVDSDFTEYWSDSTLVYLPSTPSSGAFAGKYTLVVVACTAQGGDTIPDPTNWNEMPGPAATYPITCGPSTTSGGDLRIWAVDANHNIAYTAVGTWSGKAP